ncbi:ASCH domain-containing protein [Streptococcus fryi]
MTAEDMWEAYKQLNPDIGDTVSAFQFGAETDILADLVLKGIKTATSSAYPLYEHFGEDWYDVGCYDVVLDSQGNAVCIIKTNKVYTTPFDQITSEHAYKEGEGDRSLDYWRTVHEAFFKKCLSDIGLIFNEKMLVVCEEFECVYPTNVPV